MRRFFLLKQIFYKSFMPKCTFAKGRADGVLELAFSPIILFYRQRLLPTFADKCRTQICMKTEI